MAQPERFWPIKTTLALMSAVTVWSALIWMGEIKSLRRVENAKVAERNAISSGVRKRTPSRLTAIRHESTVAGATENSTAQSQETTRRPPVAEPRRLPVNRWISRLGEQTQSLWFAIADYPIRPPKSADSASSTSEPMPTLVREQTPAGMVVLNESTTGDDAPAKTEPTRVENPEGWPVPHALLRELDHLQPLLGTKSWWPDLRHSLDELNGPRGLGDSDVASILDRLADSVDALAAESRSRAANSSSPVELETAAVISRAGYDLYRRVELWRHASRLSAIPQADNASRGIAAHEAGFRKVVAPEIDSHWREYLSLDTFLSGHADRRQAARAILGRMNSVALDSDQWAQIHTLVDPRLESELRCAASGSFQPQQLLTAVESYHDRPNGFTASRLNDVYQDLLWSDRPELLALAQTIDDHYRNANIRFAVSQTMLNRLLDRPFRSDEPVRDHILGAHVTGRSQITNRFDIQLIPDQRQWSLVLHANGSISSRTQARRDGFTIHSMGTAEVVGSKRLSISYNGVDSEVPKVDAVTDNQVIGLDSPFDDIPLLGWTARRVAHRKQEALAPQADQIVRSRIRSRVQERMEQGVADALKKAKSELDRVMVDPFIEWSLEPQPVEMSTTENELILRYRLAGFDQMGADAPRPTIEDDRAISLQIHQSAINNGLQRLDLAGRSFTLESLIDQLAEKLKTSFPEPTATNTHQAEVDFAPYDPIRVDFDRDGVDVAIHLKRLQVDGGKCWRNVTVQTRYEVSFDGFYLTLNQSGGVRASGSRIRVREELAIGAIFDQLLQDEYRFSLLPQSYEADFAEIGIRLDHIGLADGWLSVAYRDSVEPRAESPTSTR